MPKKMRSKRYWLNLLWVGLIWGVVLYLQGVLVLLMIPAHSNLGGITPATIELPYEDVALTAPDGVTLRGWYIPSQNHAVVILLHGYGGNRLGMMLHAKFLAKYGYGVLLYDERASGESGGSIRSYGWQDVGDVEPALEYLQNRPEVDPAQIGILGCSTGAEIALGATVAYPALKGVVAEGAGNVTPADLPAPRNFKEWFLWLPFRPMFKLFEWETGVHAPRPLHETISGISPRPILLITAGQAEEPRQAEFYFDNALPPKDHWNIPEAMHCGGILAQPEAYEARIVSFFDQAIGGR